MCFNTRGALHRVTAARLATAAAQWAPSLAHLPQPRAAVLLGGSNRRYRFTAAIAAQLAQQLAALARSGIGLMITPSRRTDPAVVSTVRNALRELPVVIWDGAGDNPYFAYLGLADHVIVTGDSVNMVSEACATGQTGLHCRSRWPLGQVRAFSCGLARGRHDSALRR